VVIDRQLYQLGDQEWGGAAVGDRFGDAALAELLRRLDPAKLRGTTTFAFVAQQWSGARGLERVLTRYKPDELIYIGRLLPGRGLTGEARPAHFPTEAQGSGVLVGVADLASPLAGFAAQLEHIAQQNEIRITPDYSAPLMPASYLPTPPLPGRTVHLAIATASPSTPAETVNANDLIDLVMLLEDYLQGRSVRPALPPAQVLAPPALPPRPRSAPSPEAVLRDLTECYGVSGHEADVRNTVRRLLPSWARPSTDPAGNLILRVASAPASARAPHILVDAHLDEIGFQVRMILPNGRLAVESLGGFLPYYYLGHSCFIHTSQGIRPGVMELPKGWHSPGFTWSQGRNAIYRVDAGAASAAAAGQLGIHVGDFITVPKKYRRLAGTRATVRSMDDRVGDAALVAAAWALGPNLKNRNIVFMWSTGEELGLVGAAKAAARWAAEKRTPDYVFAVDTFVSADSPLESKRFADAPLGAGFVVRAVDNSNIVPRPLVERLLRLARQNHIPAQDGVTGGGNDGAAFLRYGSVDVALGWPMRYSHSPAEEIDTRDLDALARIIVVVSRNW
jgi:putative aminopeptidase